MIKTADGYKVNEGDRVFSHYTMTWGTIREAKDWGDNNGIWFDFVDDDGKRTLLNGERICKNKPAWIRD